MSIEVSKDIRITIDNKTSILSIDEAIDLRDKLQAVLMDVCLNESKNYRYFAYPAIPVNHIQYNYNHWYPDKRKDTYYNTTTAVEAF